MACAVVHLEQHSLLQMMGFQMLPETRLRGASTTHELLYYLTFLDNQGSTQNTLAQPVPPRQWGGSGEALVLRKP